MGATLVGQVASGWRQGSGRCHRVRGHPPGQYVAVLISGSLQYYLLVSPTRKLPSGASRFPCRRGVVQWANRSPRLFTCIEKRPAGLTRIVGFSVIALNISLAPWSGTAITGYTNLINQSGFDSLGPSEKSVPTAASRSLQWRTPPSPTSSSTI